MQNQLRNLPSLRTVFVPHFSIKSVINRASILLTFLLASITFLLPLHLLLEQSLKQKFIKLAEVGCREKSAVVYANRPDSRGAGRRRVYVSYAASRQALLQQQHTCGERRPRRRRGVSGQSSNGELPRAPFPVPFLPLNPLPFFHKDFLQYSLYFAP